jgi:UDP-N-acetylglucosamine transferase subunit ALG13
MIFLTLGTYPMPFDRLLKAIDELAAVELKEVEIFAQIGFCSYEPKNIQFKRMMTKEVFDEIFKKSDGLIAHAGMGSIVMALDYNKPILVMPRLKKHAEHVNDHQLGTAQKFEELGHVLVAYEECNLLEKIGLLEGFRPAPRTNSAEKVAERIGAFINILQSVDN